MTKIFTLFLTISIAFFQNSLAQSSTKTDSLETNKLAVGDRIARLKKNISLTKSDQDIMIATTDLADIYYKIEAYDKAYLHYTKALQIAEEKK